MDTLHPTDSAPMDADDRLAECLQRLAERGSVADPVELLTFIPPLDHDFRRNLLVELIKLDMAMSAEESEFRGIDAYLAIEPQLLSSSTVPLDLVLEEIQLRRDLGETPDIAEYQRRYPKLASLLMPQGHTINVNPVGVSNVPAEITLGQRMDDFLIVRKLGQGAFAHVYLAEQISMKRLVALKVSRGKGGESQSLAQFDHPNIVRVFDQRLIENASTHLLYMQFVPGGTLADVIKKYRSALRDRPDRLVDGKLLLGSIDDQMLAAAQLVPDQSATRDWIAGASWPQLVAWLGVQICRALQEAHSHGIIHRDVKPANVLLTAEGIPKLADFNVSFSDQDSKDGSLGGSAAYMSPEHLAAILDKKHAAQENIRETSDLYSLAVLLWELWQVQRPFQCQAVTSPADALADQLESRHRPLLTPLCRASADGTVHTEHLAVQRALEKTLRQALSVDPSDRFADGAEMAGRLRLSLYPQAATMFDPPQSSWRDWLSQRSPWLLAGTVLLIPHAIAGGLNYQYNYNEVTNTPELKESLRLGSWLVNFVYFSIAGLFAIWQTGGMVRAVQSARQNQRVSGYDLSHMLELGYRAAIIGGLMWVSSGILFPVIFHNWHHDFVWTKSLQLFLSALICGGIAMVYPYFGLAWLTTFVFYPQCVRSTMQDSEFDNRSARLIGRGETFTLIAAILPLIGGVLMISWPTSSRAFMMTAVIAGMLGILVTWFIHQRVLKAWSRMGQVLSSQGTTIPQ